MKLEKDIEKLIEGNPLTREEIAGRIGILREDPVKVGYVKAGRKKMEVPVASKEYLSLLDALDGMRAQGLVAMARDREEGEFRYYLAREAKALEEAGRLGPEKDHTSFTLMEFAREEGFFGRGPDTDLRRILKALAWLDKRDKAVERKGTGVKRGKGKKNV